MLRYNIKILLLHFRAQNRKWSFFLIKRPDFRLETFQNWQSEFLSVTSTVVLTLFLRQKGSPESKSVDTPNLETGE